MNKKLLSLLLVVCLVMMLLPATALAANPTGAFIENIKQVINAIRENKTWHQFTKDFWNFFGAAFDNVLRYIGNVINNVTL